MLILATAWVAEPYLIAIWASAGGPRTVTPRGDLTQAEQATIKPFQTVSPSVVHVFAQGGQQGSPLEEQQEGVVLGCGWTRDHELSRDQRHQSDRGSDDIGRVR